MVRGWHMLRRRQADVVRGLLLTLVLGFYLLAMRRLWGTLTDGHPLFGSILLVCVVAYLLLAWTQYRTVGVVLAVLAHVVSGVVGGISGGQTWFLMFGIVVDVNARRHWRIGIGLSVLVAATAVGESLLRGGVPWVIMWVAVMTLFGRFIADRNRTIAQLQRIWQLEQVEERLKLAQAMHDEVASSLSQGLVVLRSLWTTALSDEQDHKLHQVEQALMRSSTALRTAIWDLKGAAGGAVSVPVLLHEQVCALQAAGFTPTLVIEGDWSSNDGRDRLWSALIREAVANVLRHAQAGSEVTIAATSQSKQRRLLVENAVCETAAQEKSDDQRLGGNGLVNLSRRVGANGGTLLVERDGEVWRLTAVVPAAAKIGE